jgi:hypothetical protein
MIAAPEIQVRLAGDSNLRLGHRLDLELRFLGERIQAPARRSDRIGRR